MPSRPTTYLLGAAAAVTVIPLVLVALGGGANLDRPAACATTAPPDAVVGVAGLNSEQIQVARQIVAAVRAFTPTAHLPDAAVIALATARQESGIRNLTYGDRDSLGVFQQRPSQGWGTPEEILDVAHATTTFLTRLVQVPHWRTIPVTEAAAQVQRPAEENRGLYAQWVPMATALTKQLWTEATPPNEATASALGNTTGLTTELTAGLTTDGSLTGDCPGLVLTSAGVVTYPVPADLAGTDRHNWGDHGGHWASWHTGTDFAVACGTPVLAATAGTVEVQAGPDWFGSWLVKVVTGPTSLSTWYAHMQELTVQPGQLVSAGDPIGEVGDRGNTTGCHLHFEVHLQNGTIYGPDNTDPSAWLASHVGTSLDGGPNTTRVASFNVLGASHTQPGGNSSNHIDAATRMALTVQALTDHQIEIVGMQEFQPAQERTFRDLTAGTWSHFPDSRGRPGAANVVAWSTNTWQPLAAERIPIPYFGGTSVLMPYVLLQNSAGQRVWVVSVHNPADTRGSAQQWRDEAVRIEADLVNQLGADGTPVLLTGDMNDRARFYCHITSTTPLQAANGGISSPDCRPPEPTAIDWILGTPTLAFAGFTSTRAGGLQEASDHPLIYTDVQIP
jgi:murein DD-endopeptidase MepM/ murein hydrolase activator NlpD/endonuclease/exonuclease/phosphatase family metal-dependent hydrolase